MCIRDRHWRARRACRSGNVYTKTPHPLEACALHRRAGPVCRCTEQNRVALAMEFSPLAG
eukprot:31546-Alexandrium_andersonii.AAC.1